MHIPESEIQFIFSRSGGKGGQNVNKVESRVQLRWSADHSAVFSFAEKMMISRALHSRMTEQGEVSIDVDTSRSQAQNRAEAIERLQALVAQALIPPKPRKKTRPTRASKLKRLDSKRRSSERKQSRKRLAV